MKEYIEKATRTESLDLFKVDSARILHAVIGVNTEMGELFLATDDTNLVEEVGDVLWYIAIFASEIEASFDELELLGKMELETEELEIDSMESLFQVTSDTLDVVKRALFYGVELDEVKIARKFGVILLALRHHLADDGYTIEMAMDANIAKLTKRYGDKFTTEACVDRDLAGELEELKSRIQ